MKNWNRTFNALIVAVMLVTQLLAPTAHMHVSESATSHKNLQFHDHAIKFPDADGHVISDNDTDHSDTDMVFLSHDAVIIKPLTEIALKNVIFSDAAYIIQAEPLEAYMASRAPPLFEPPADFSKVKIPSGFNALAPPLV